MYSHFTIEYYSITRQEFQPDVLYPIFCNIRSMLAISRITQNFFLLGFLTMTLSTFAQSRVDSLTVLLENAKDEKRIDLLNQISRSTIYSQPAESEQMAENALSESRELKYKKGQVSALVNLGARYNNRSELPKANQVLSEAMETAKAIGFREDLAYGQLNLSVLEIRRNNYAKALDHNYTGLEVSKEIENQDLIISHLVNIGVIRQILEEYDASEKALKEALLIAETFKLDLRIGSILGNLAIIKCKQKNYGDCISYHKQGLKAFENRDNKIQQAVSLLNIGTAYAELGEGDQAMKYFNLSLELRETLNDRLGKGRVLFNKGKLKKREGDLNAATNLSLEALTIFEDYTNLRLIRDVYQLLYELYEEQAAPVKALTYYKAFVATRDSMDNRANKSRMEALTAQYDFDRLENQRQLQLQESQIKDLEISKKNQLIVAILLLLLISVIVFYTRWKTLKNRLELTARDREIAEKDLTLKSRDFASE